MQTLASLSFELQIAQQRLRATFVESQVPAKARGKCQSAHSNYLSRGIGVAGPPADMRSRIEPFGWVQNNLRRGRLSWKRFLECWSTDRVFTQES